VIPNPVGVEALTDVVMALEGPRRLHSIAVTGGEPLLQHAFLRRWLPVAQQRGYRAYLETAGIHRERLSAIIDHTDFCSMDVKLPSTSGLRSYLDRHRDFLCACRDAAIPTQAKAVVGARTPRDEIAECAGMVGATWPDAVLVLQPATPTARQSDVPSPAHLLDLQSVALHYVERVLVIPQTHRLVGLQ
jgi:pyruvate-formate lyase-activating enzyme